MMLKPGQLAVVSTPIGNLGDLSPRAAEAMEKADILACEDTRMTRKLMALSGQPTAKLISNAIDRDNILACVTSLPKLVTHAPLPLLPSPK